MRNKKNLIWIIPVVIIGVIHAAFISVMFIGKINQSAYLDRRPDVQAYTTWVSEDGKIRIHTDEKFDCKIYFEQDDETKEYYFTSGLSYEASVHYPDYVDRYTLEEEKTLPTIEEYEEWEFTEYKKNSFTIVVKKTTFLEVGQTITFHKVENAN